MASVRWNSQRLAATRRGLSTSKDDWLGVGGKIGRSQEVGCFNHSSRSFVEVVNGLENGIQEHGSEVKKKILSMSWDSNIYDDNWLNNYCWKKGNFDAALEVGFEIGQLKNADIKALDGSIELLRVVGSGVGHIGRSVNMMGSSVGQSDRSVNVVGSCVWQGGKTVNIDNIMVASLDSVESDLANRRSVKVFGSKDGSCGGVSVSSIQVVYFNFEEEKDPKGVNFGSSDINLFVDLESLEPFVRKGGKTVNIDNIMVASLDSVESDLANRRSVKVFGSKDGSCGGVSVSSIQVVYFNFEEEKDPKGVNFGSSAIDLFVDLGSLEPFVRKVDVGGGPVVIGDDPAVATSLRKAQSQGSSLKSFVFAMNLHVSSKDHHRAVFYFATEDPIPYGSLLYWFINGDDAFPNQRRPSHNKTHTSLISSDTG
ncbi:hypothetical protein Dsin_003589 [Dipteronia sinensis]|uniref:Protein ENHANCED DISEASE RESISTANCE 2 C-terminal domain-containing protein n=1 Tax=Dipteronia sinensis TaxID=43782 RepID=A0AAE0B976_9ROSI|nr:hypothetical protein Dsin_003589 [Dipteronia sinensis]